MIVSWNWLTEYVRLDLPEPELSRQLMMAGFNHESTEEVEGDLAIDLEVTSNRPDCLGHLGVAREIAALTGQLLKLPTADFTEHEPATSSRIAVEILPEASWCPQYRARVIENVKLGPSPAWMQRRLKAAGMTPVSNVVDITNYVMLETGQPHHAFDLAKVRGGRIIVRNARAGEKLVAINGKTYDLQSWAGVIADAEGAVALAGVMGGLDSEISAGTTTVLLETAEFLPLTIRRASRGLDLPSDASYRFERKLDPRGLAFASDRCCNLLEKLCGGRVLKGAVHAGAPGPEPGPVTLRFHRLRDVLSLEIPADRAVSILETLGLRVIRRTGDSVTATPPSWRRDLTREIDLVEEVGRIVGYEEVSDSTPLPMSVSVRSKKDRVTAIVREQLVGAGYCEAVAMSFASESAVASVRPWSSAEPLKVSHSSRRRENSLRQSLIPSLLASLRLNEARQVTDAELFELAHVYLPATGVGLPEEPTVLGGVSTRDLRLVRGHLEGLFRRLRLTVSLRPEAVPGFDPERSAAWYLGERRIGVLGHVAESVKADVELRLDAVAFELRLEPLFEAADLAPRVAAPPELPAVDRDFAFVLDETVRWAALEETVRGSAGPCLESLEFVDLYRGKQVPDGKKSIAFRMVYRAADRTLTRDEVDGYQQSVRQAVESKLGGVLRA
jgi:phenylalanyl-tRNA synthetase beta chain